MLASRLSALWRYRDLLANLVLRDMRIKYKGSTLGFAWSLLHPLLMAAVYTLAFKYIVQMQVDHFPIFLLTGLLPWIFFASALTSATASIAENGTLVRKVAFPRAILPLGSVASQFVQFALMYAVIVPIALVTIDGASPAVVALVPIVLLQLVFTAGLALVLATAHVHFRDTRHLLEVLLQMWFWVTPIVYPLARVPARFRGYFAFNPMTWFVQAYQNIVLHQAVPSATAIAVLVAAAGASALLGFGVFLRYERRFAELV